MAQDQVGPAPESHDRQILNGTTNSAEKVTVTAATRVQSEPCQNTLSPSQNTLSPSTLPWASPNLLDLPTPESVKQPLIPYITPDGAKTAELLSSDAITSGLTPEREGLFSEQTGRPDPQMIQEPILIALSTTDKQNPQSTQENMETASITSSKWIQLLTPLYTHQETTENSTDSDNQFVTGRKNQPSEVASYNQTERDNVKVDCHSRAVGDRVEMSFHRHADAGMAGVAYRSQADDDMADPSNARSESDCHNQAGNIKAETRIIMAETGYHSEADNDKAVTSTTKAESICHSQTNMDKAE